MTLYERIAHFTAAGMSQEDPTPVHEVIDRMSPSDLLAEISDALERAGITFNTDF